MAKKAAHRWTFKKTEKRGHLTVSTAVSACMHVCVCVCAADSMDSSSKQFVSVDDVAVTNGDANAGMNNTSLTLYLNRSPLSFRRNFMK